MRNFILFTSSFIAGSMAAYNPDEHLVLVNCGPDILATGEATSQQVAYYKATYNPSGGAGAWAQPDMIANVPWDGSYPWRPEGVIATMPDNTAYQVFIDPKVKDWAESSQYSGKASQTLGDAPFKCWGEHGRPAFVADGVQCVSAHICHHSPEEQSGAKPTVKTIATNSTMSSMEVAVRVQGTNREVESWKPVTVMDKVMEAIEGNQCNTKSFAIGTDCKIAFQCHFTNTDRSEAVAKVLTDAIAPLIEQTYTEKEVNFRPKCGADEVCDDGFSFQSGEYSYPETGKVLMVVIEDGDLANALPQAWIDWKVTCEDSSFCGSFCGTNKETILDLTTGWAAPVADVFCIGCV